MYSIKPGRGPSAMGAVGGVIAVIVGTAWTFMAISVTQDAPTGFRFFFPIFGIVFVILGITNIVYCLYNVSNKNRLSVLDVTTDREEPDPLNLKFGVTSNQVSSASEVTTEQKLQELQHLYEKGLVNEAEYTVQRRRILDSI